MQHEKGIRRQFNKEERAKILKKTACKCGHCGRALNEDTMTVDHVFPIHKGGENDEFNLIALCMKCNQEKSNWVYRVNEYYKYILPEYMKDYISYNLEKSSSYRANQLIRYDAVTYTIIPDHCKQVILNMCRRKGGKKQIKKIVDRAQMKLILTKAYEGDAEDIFKLINYSKDKISILNTDIYDSVYQVLNDIKYHEVYVLRKGNSIHGAFVFRYIDKIDLNLDYVQLANIEECTRLRKKYIMTLACLDYFAGELLPEIMEDMYSSMLSCEAIPMYFNILSGIYRKKSEIICIPTKLDGIEGHLEFMQLKAIKQRLFEDIDAVLENSTLGTEDSNTRDALIDNMVERMLCPKEDSNKLDDLSDIRDLLFNSNKFLDVCRSEGMDVSERENTFKVYMAKIDESAND